MITKKADTLRVLTNNFIKRNEPISVVHFLTNRCNARCSFCFIDFDDPETFKGELNLDEIKLMTKNMGKSLLNVNFTGGEPFARKEINDIAKYYYENTTIQSIYITTNGSLPDRIKKFCEQFKNYKDLEITFQISIDDLPDKHNKSRKIKNLFEKCIETFNFLKSFSDNITPVVCITVSEENSENIEHIYNTFTSKYKIDAIKCIAVRDEGIYKSTDATKKKILKAYTKLTNLINEDTKLGKLKNYNTNSLQGRLHRKKDEISTDIVKKTFLTPKFISPCHASSLFGVIYPNGDLYPCEILPEKKIGNLRNYNMNFLKIWKDKKNLEIKKYILDSKCNCTYECALSYNILSNYRYQPQLLLSALGF